MVHPANPGGGTNDTSLGPGRARVRKDMSETNDAEGSGYHALEHDQAVWSPVHLRSMPSRWSAVGHKHEAFGMARHLQLEPEAER